MSNGRVAGPPLLHIDHSSRIGKLVSLGDMSHVSGDVGWGHSRQVSGSVMELGTLHMQLLSLLDLCGALNNTYGLPREGQNIVLNQSINLTRLVFG